MENKQSPSKKKLISIQEEKLIREINYDYLAAGPTRPPKKSLLLDLEIFQKKTTHQRGTQKVLVSIKPRVPAIKTLYIAEKSRFHSRKSLRHLLPDFDYVVDLSEDNSNVVSSIACGTASSKGKIENVSSLSIDEQSSTFVLKCPHENPSQPNLYNDKQKHTENCYLYTQPQLNINLPNLEATVEKSTHPARVNISTSIVTPSDDIVPAISCTIINLHKRMDHLERKVFRQEMVYRTLDPNSAILTSSDEEAKQNIMKSSSGTERPGCSYIQYSHVPGTSAFQRYAHQAAPLSPSKATTIEKEHNSEQYGRDFTAYDGITARGRRQCASVPCKRDDIPKLAAERVHKIRHKLNPVRDYRLMDTVHYLAQGEFAPRDDGIKLTPSREAVLSDIIWEDVCRTHWPNTRLGRRMAHPERCGTRCELQRLIDSLLRERVAHVERRRRRHYRIVKLNHRHESCRPVGKTGDIIVASHKNRPGSDINTGSASVSNRQREEQNPRNGHRCHDRLMGSDLRQMQQPREDDCSPGPSYKSHSPSARQQTCCYHTSTRPQSSACETQPHINQCSENKDFTSGSSVSASQRSSIYLEGAEPPVQKSGKKDIGFNVNIVTISNSAQKLNKN
ncbi:Uncharacterized protein OBRU01_01554 [Operophtera brumata]|uniref:Uncharacterized protein n=1 Tax=Operophtera brumata TaxID=104452 RepID=A0A0L7LLC9_OPEBR|nr:Uncharacterized protein OBRU01_01554 [Operophtera brumata]